MKTDFFQIYDRLIDSMDESGGEISSCLSSHYWSLVETETHQGIAMSTQGESIAPMYPQGFQGLSLKQAAAASKSWNMMEAAAGLAAANAWYNSPKRLEELNCYEPFENYCTAGLDFNGKTVGMIGHMNGPEGLKSQVKALHIIERSPQPGDYPDSACDYILPQCDVVIISGSTLVNKTLPHLLQLCQNAYTILTGPSVPMCPELLELGIDRLAGMVLFDREGIHSHVKQAVPGSPYRFGKPFLLKKR